MSRVPASPTQHRARRQFLRETERLVEAVTVDRCQWVEGVCVTRKSLHRAVVEVTRQPPGDLRDAAFAVANAAYEAHVERCKRPLQAGPVGGGSVHAVAASAPAGQVCICQGGGFSKVDGALARLCPVHGQPTASPTTAKTPATPTLMDLHRLVLEISGAALVYGMRLERKAHPDAPADTEDKIEEAERRMTEASAAYHRAMDAYRPGRQPISAYLPKGEWPRG